MKTADLYSVTVHEPLSFKSITQIRLELVQGSWRYNNEIYYYLQIFCTLVGQAVRSLNFQ